MRRSRLDEREGAAEDREVVLAPGRRGAFAEPLETPAGRLLDDRAMGRGAVVGRLVARDDEEVRAEELVAERPGTREPVERETLPRGMVGRAVEVRELPERETGARGMVGRAVEAREAVDRELDERALGDLELVDRETGDLELDERALGDFELADRETGDLELDERALGDLELDEREVVAGREALREVLRVAEGRLERDAEEVDRDRPDGGFAAIAELVKRKPRHRQASARICRRPGVPPSSERTLAPCNADRPGLRISNPEVVLYPFIIASFRKTGPTSFRLKGQSCGNRTGNDRILDE